MRASLVTRLLILLLCMTSLLPSLKAQEKTDGWLEELLHHHASPLLKNVLNKPDTFQYQVIYTSIDRDVKNQPHFKNYYLNVNRNRYFNPASTVKLPTNCSFFIKRIGYDTTEFFDGFTKFFLFRAAKSKVPSHIKYYNKPGWSYGFLTDAAYIVDLKNKVEFMLSAVIYVNSDGVLNDDKYEYEQIGYPFFKEVGEIIYEYELKRDRKYKPIFEVLRPAAF